MTVTDPAAAKAVLQTTGHVGINVTDLARSMAFYREVFGLDVVAESHDDGREFAFLGADGNVILTLWQQADDGFDASRAGLHHLSFQVDAMDQVRAAEARLQGLDATFSYDGVVPHAESAGSGGIFFTDPDGTRLEIYAPSGAEGHDAPSGSAPTCGFF